MLVNTIYVVSRETGKPVAYPKFVVTGAVGGSYIFKGNSDGSIRFVIPGYSYYAAKIPSGDSIGYISADGFLNGDVLTGDMYSTAGTFTISLHSSGEEHATGLLTTKGVDISGTPEGAEIWEGYNLLGNSPMSLIMNRELHTLTFRKDGYLDGVQYVLAEQTKVVYSLTKKSDPSTPVTPSKQQIILTINTIAEIGNTRSQIIDWCIPRIEWILSKINWLLVDYKIEGKQIILTLEKEGSPAIPILAIVAIIAIVIGIVSWSWKAVNVERSHVEEIKAQTENIKTKEDLINLLTSQYEEGLIDKETYSELLNRLITDDDQKEEGSGSWWSNISNVTDLISGIAPLLIIALIANIFKK